MSKSKKTELPLMNGTACSDCYLVVARRGDIVLGVRLLGFTTAESYGIKDKSIMSARIRSAYLPEGDTKGGKKVVSLEDKKIDLETAWPDIKFSKSNKGRASVVVDTFIRGSVSTDLPLVVENLKNSDNALGLAQHIDKLAGDGNLTMRVSAIRNWLQDQITPTIKAMEASVAVSNKMQTESESLVGVFGDHSAMLKDLYAKVTAQEEGPKGAKSEKDKVTSISKAKSAS